MAKISDLPELPNADGTETVAVVSRGLTKRIALALLAAPMVAAAAAQATLAQARALIAQQAANDSGAYLNAIKALTGSSPLSAAMTIQAASRAVLAQIVAPAAGTQAYLGETGREGTFVWISGDQATRVTADPDQALYVAPVAQPTGSAGAWRRIMSAGFALASWAGVVADGTGNHAPAIKRLLAFPEVQAVQVPAGTTGLGESIKVPDRKSLIGAGKTASILQAVGWVFTGDTGDAFLTSHYMVVAGSGSRVTDMTVDGAKTGAKQILQTSDNNRRLNGVVALGADSFVGERLHVANITGYGLLFSGATSSRFSHCSTANVQVHCEATNGSRNCSYNDVACRGGDGDIGCEAPFHVLNGSQIIAFRDCSFVGDAGSGLLVVSNEPTGIPTTGVTAENLSIRLTGATTCITVTNLVANASCEVDIIGGSYSSNGSGYGLTNCTVRVNGATVAASSTAVSGANAVLLLANATTALGADLPPGGYAQFWNIDAATRVTIDGGRLIGKANGENSLQPLHANSIRIIGQPDTRGAPTPELAPLGVGHRLIRSTSAAITGPEFTVRDGLFGAPLSFVMIPNALYRVRLAGSVSSAKDKGFAICLRGGGGGGKLYGGDGFLQSSVDDIAPPVRAVMHAWLDYFRSGNTLASPSSAPANEPHQFAVDAMVRCGPDGNSMSVYAAAYAGPSFSDGFGSYAVNNTGAGIITVHADTVLTVEQIDG